MTPVLVGRGLVVRYGTTTVLNELDITASARECLAIRGANGSGRTTLLEVLSTLRVPSAGTLTINGVDARRAPRAARAQLALASADLVSGDGLTVREYLRVVREARVSASTSAHMDLEAVIDRAQLRSLASVDALSRGQRARLALATTLMLQPALLLLDDPLASLDAEGRTRFIDWIVEARSAGSAIVAALNTAADVDALATASTRLEAGRLVGATARSERADAPEAVRLPNRVSGAR